MVKVGDVALFKRGNGIIINIIKRVTQSEYWHAGFVAYVNTKKREVQIIEALFFKGVTSNIYNLDDNRFDFFEHLDMKPKKRLNIQKNVHTYLGRGYDWKGTLYRFWLSITFRRRSLNKWHNPNKPNCSEFVAILYEKEGLYFNKDIPIANTAPATIERSKYTRLIKSKGE